MLALAERREKASRLKITRYLRDVAPDETRHLQNADLDRHIADSNASAARFGLRSERDLGLWAYVMVKYDWRATAPPVVAHMSGSGAGASERLTTLADAIFRRTPS